MQHGWRHRSVSLLWVQELKVRQGLFPLGMGQESILWSPKGWGEMCMSRSPH